MEKTARRRPPRALSCIDYAQVRLSDELTMRLTGASRSTVRRWRLGLTPVPLPVLRVVSLIRHGELSFLFGEDFREFRIQGGEFHLPGFKHGIRPAELRTWWIKVQEAMNQRYAAEQARRDLQRAEERIEALERDLAFYRRQVRLEGRLGMMLAGLPQ